MPYRDHLGFDLTQPSDTDYRCSLLFFILYIIPRSANGYRDRAFVLVHCFGHTVEYYSLHTRYAKSWNLQNFTLNSFNRNIFKRLTYHTAWRKFASVYVSAVLHAQTGWNKFDENRCEVTSNSQHVQPQSHTSSRYQNSLYLINVIKRKLLYLSMDMDRLHKYAYITGHNGKWDCEIQILKYVVSCQVSYVIDKSYIYLWLYGYVHVPCLDICHKHTCTYRLLATYSYTYNHSTSCHLCFQLFYTVCTTLMHSQSHSSE